MINMDLQVRAGGQISYLKKISRAIKWAHIRSINDVGEAVQHHMVNDHFPKTFTLRGKWYMPRNKYGIKLYKAYRGRNFAVIGTSAPWMALHDKGGIKTPQQTARQAAAGKSNKFFAVAESARTSHAAKVRRPKYISRIAPLTKMDPPKARWVSVKKGNSNRLLLINYSKTRSDGKGVVEYSALRSARIKPVLRFEQVAQMVVARKYNSIWAENFVKEMQSAKKA